jgi:FkbM family methyltransferase
MSSLKTLLRNALPRRFQVPVKFAYGRLRGDMEAEMALLPDLVGRGDHVVDIGGNRGTYAYALWKLGARVEVFEPNPDCADVLRGWAAGKDRVNVHSVALSDEPGVAQLHVPVDAHGVEHDASASIEGAAEPGSRILEVALRTLDSFAFTDASLIKIDVEGHEAKVIAGAAETLRAARPALIVEIEQRHIARPIASIFEQVASLGYRGFFLLGGKLVGIESFDPERHQSLDAFASGSGEYHNNFLFLGETELASGRYQDLARRWMAS